MLVINLLGMLVIALIIWWFWLYKPREAIDMGNGKKVTVENGTYQPARIKLVAKQSVQIEFLRNDSSPCAATVIFPELDLSVELPIGRKKLVTIPALTKGEYAFHCPMQMYHGTLVVE